MFDLNDDVFSVAEIDNTKKEVAEEIEKEKPIEKKPTTTKKTTSTTAKKRKYTRKTPVKTTTVKKNEEKDIKEVIAEKTDTIIKNIESPIANEPITEEKKEPENNKKWLIGQKVFIIGEGSKPYKCQNIENGIASVYSITEGINKKIKSDLISHKPNYNRF